MKPFLNLVITAGLLMLSQQTWSIHRFGETFCGSPD